MLRLVHLLVIIVIVVAKDALAVKGVSVVKDTQPAIALVMIHATLRLNLILKEIII